MAAKFIKSDKHRGTALLMLNTTGIQIKKKVTAHNTSKLTI